VAMPLTEVMSIPTPPHHEDDSVKLAFQRMAALWFVVAAGISIALAAGWHVSILESSESVRWVVRSQVVLSFAVVRDAAEKVATWILKTARTKCRVPKGVAM
jgi:hypothetical protein